MKRSALVSILMLFTQALQLLTNPMECQENEYLNDHGTCILCKECGPGLELSKECGYGEGSNAQCMPCQPRRFKDSWGRQGCRPCLSCSLINRIQKSNCSSTSDATCGECFSGFYSKSQIGGLQALECIPCTKQTPSSELQCRSRVSLVKIHTTPAQDVVHVVLTSSALVIISVVLMTVSVLYCQRFWKGQCRRGPAEAVQFVSGGEVSGFHLPCQQPGPDSSKALPARGFLETQPVLRNSGCSDCAAGVSSFPEISWDSEGPTDGAAPSASCATDLQHGWPHAPVECTELDLHNFSTPDEVKQDAGNSTSQRVGSRASANGIGTITQASLPWESIQVSCPSFQTPTAESEEQLGDDTQSLLIVIGRIAQGFSIANLPRSLVLSLALQLDPPLPNVKDFSHLGMELGVPSHQLSRMSGFEELVEFFANSGNPVSVLALAQALQKLQCFDSLLLLYDHFTRNRTLDFQH